MPVANPPDAFGRMEDPSIRLAWRISHDPSHWLLVPVFGSAGMDGQLGLGAEKLPRRVRSRSPRTPSPRQNVPNRPPRVKSPAAKSAEESAATPPATHTVKKGPLKITVELEGVFEAQTAQEILVKPEEWTALMVESAVAARRPGPQGRRAPDTGDREARPGHRRPPQRT